MKRKTFVLFMQAIVACAGVYVSQQSIKAQGVAPQPGFVSGTGTFSATPLEWTPAQFIRLAFDIAAGRLLEQPSIVAQRYLHRQH